MNNLEFIHIERGEHGRRTIVFKFNNGCSNQIDIYINDSQQHVGHMLKLLGEMIVADGRRIIG